MPKRRGTPSKTEQKTPLKRKNVMKSHELEALMDIAIKLRIHSVQMTEASKSGYPTQNVNLRHPTTCSSIAEIMTALFFDPSGMKYDPLDPKNLNNDKYFYLTSLNKVMQDN